MMKINYLIKLINSLDQLLLDHQCQLVILKRGAIFYVKNELLKTLPNPHSHLVKYWIAIPPFSNHSKHDAIALIKVELNTVQFNY